MSVQWIHLLLFGLAGAFMAPSAFAQDARPVPDFKEVYDRIRENLPEITPAELNKAAVEGFVAKLSPRVSLLASNAPARGPQSDLLVSRASVIDKTLGYLRIARVDAGLAGALKGAYGQLAGTNTLKGLVLDLRYASGSDYAAVSEAAFLFSKKKQPTLNWGEGMKETGLNPDAITLPVAVLVNAETTGASEALAAVLRELGAGLIFGSKTAGQALIAREVPLQNGDRLRIAAAPIDLADGSKLTGEGVVPDIAVHVNPQDEQAYFADPYATLRTNLLASVTLAGENGTNRLLRRPRLNEAELVRERREGMRPDTDVAGDVEPARPTLQDPVLARACDVLKGLAVIRRIGS